MKDALFSPSQFFGEQVIFVRFDRTYPILFTICCVLSTLSVSMCVGYHLVIEHHIDAVHPSDYGVSSDVLSDFGSGLPSEPPLDERGLTVISDTVSVQNFLLIGTDARTPGQSCRSDVMILISLNHESKKIVACSLLRDMLVSIDGYGENRLNSAYSFGGAQLLLETLKNELNIDILDCVSVDFSAFSQIIDILGGVDITVSSEEARAMNEICRLTDSGVSQIPLKDGTYHLNGAQALAYARDRSSAGGDFDRTERQRKILNALIQNMKRASLFELMNLFSVILPNITTNIPEDQLKSLVDHLPEYLNYTPIFTAIPQNGTFSFVTVREMSVIKVDFEANIRYLSEQIYS